MMANPLSSSPATTVDTSEHRDEAARCASIVDLSVRKIDLYCDASQSSCVHEQPTNVFSLPVEKRRCEPWLFGKDVQQNYLHGNALTFVDIQIDGLVDNPRLLGNPKFDDPYMILRDGIFPASRQRHL